MINDFNKFKQRNSSIKFEDLQLEKDYAFTISPQRSSASQSKLLLRQDASIARTIKEDFYNISQCLKTAEITVAPECSTNSALIHYHGTVMIKNYIDWMTEYKLLTNIGTVCVKEIDDLEVWSNYCYKQSHIFAEFLKLKTHFSYPYTIPIPARLADESNDGEE